MIQEITTILLLHFYVYSATVSAYAPETVDSRWGGVARWTGETPVVGLTVACPESWRMEWVYIESIGMRQCQDTPATGWYGETPHIDAFMSSRQEALNHGIQQLTVWKARK